MNSREERIIKNFLLEFENQKETHLSLNSIIPSLVLSRKLLKNGKETKLFTKEVLGIEFKDYVFKSRTLLLGKIQKEIMKMESAQTLTILKNLTNFIEAISITNKEEVKTNSQKNDTTFFSEWSSFLNK